MTTENCTYKTPCGWCSKWDKECDKKISYPRGKRVEVGVYDDACNHDWLYLETYKVCRNCFKIVPVNYKENIVNCDHEWIYKINDTTDGSRRLECSKCGKIVNPLDGAVFY